ncbi:MAG: hypothetical protein ABIJ97_08175, partial [Bacteroidota bacterium]
LKINKMENQTNQENNVTSNEDKTVAFVSYLTLIGWIIALVMYNGGNKTKLGGFHIRQALGIFISAIAVVIVAMILVFIPFLGWLIDLLLYLALLAAWIMGFIGALSGDMKPLPVIGELYQKWFASIAKD